MFAGVMIVTDSNTFAMLNMSLQSAGFRVLAAWAQEATFVKRRLKHDAGSFVPVACCERASLCAPPPDPLLPPTRKSNVV